MIQGAFVATGAELLTPYRWDKNSLWLTEAWYRLGIRMVRKTVVGDRTQDIASSVAEAIRHCGVVAICGGLGPTRDDRTVPALAQALGLPLVRDPDIDRHLQSFRRGDKALPPGMMKQALKPRGFTAFQNRWGSAPALMGKVRGSLLIVLPGVPLEFRNLYTHDIEPELKRRIPARNRAPVFHRIIRVEERSEPILDARLSALTLEPGLELGVTVSPGTIDVHLLASGLQARAARAALQKQTRLIRRNLGDLVYGEGDETAAQVLGRLCRKKHRKLACAESCTGGLLSQKMTSVPGSSEYFLGAMVSYSNQAKKQWLEVSPSVLKKHGAVSEAAARAMARGIAKVSRADLAIAITGVAGPGGGTRKNPVGTVCFSIFDRGRLEAYTRHFHGDRWSVRERATEAALHYLRKCLL